MQGTSHSMRPSPSFPRRRESTGRGNDTGRCHVFVFGIRICGIMGICRIGTMLRIVFTLTLALSHQVRGDSGGWSVLLYAPPRPYGLRIKSAMTGSTTCSTLWIPAYAGMTGCVTADLAVQLSFAHRLAKTQSLAACCCHGWTWQRSL